MNKEFKQLKLTLIKSKYGRARNHINCVHGLGLRRIGSTAIIKDTPGNRGMINKISYLLKVEEVK